MNQYIGKKRIWVGNEDLSPEYQNKPFIVLTVNGEYCTYDYLHELKFNKPIKMKYKYVLKRSFILSPVLEVLYG